MITQQFQALHNQVQIFQQEVELWKSIATGLYDYFVEQTGVSSSVQDYIDAVNSEYKGKQNENISSTF